MLYKLKRRQQKMRLKEIKFLKFKRFYTLNEIIILPQIINKYKKIIRMT